MPCCGEAYCAFISPKNAISEKCVEYDALCGCDVVKLQRAPLLSNVRTAGVLLLRFRRLRRRQLSGAALRPYSQRFTRGLLTVSKLNRPAFRGAGPGLLGSR